MEELRYTLVAEGASDRALLPVLDEEEVSIAVQENKWRL